MSEKQLMFILAVIGIVAFTAWVVHQSLPLTRTARSGHAATRPAGSPKRPHPLAHAPVSTSAAQVEVVTPMTFRKEPASGVSVVAVYPGVSSAQVCKPGVSATATMPALGLNWREGYEPVSGATSAWLLPAATRPQPQPRYQNRLDFDAIRTSSDH